MADKSELNYFAVAPTQTVIEEKYEQRLQPVGDLKPRGQIEFYIPGDTDLYLDLNNTQLLLQCEIKNTDNSALDIADKLSVCNNVISSLFQDVKIKLNNIEVSDQSLNYPYKSYFETLLSYDYEAQKTVLKPRGWEVDDPDSSGAGIAKWFDSGAFKPGWKERNSTVQHIGGTARTFELIGPLASDIFKTDLLLPSNINVSIRLNRSSSNFVLLYGDDVTRDKDFVIEIKRATLIITRVKINPSKLIQIEKVWSSRSVRIPFTRSKVYNKTVASGISTISMQHLLRGTLPKRVFIALVKDAAYAGDKQEDPFFFNHYKLSSIQLKAGNRLIPKELLQFEFRDAATYHQKIVEGWAKFMQTVGVYHSSDSINIWPERWARGFTVFGFDLTRDMSAGQATSLLEEGQLDLTMHFAEGLPDTVTILTYCEFDEEILITKHREVLYTPLHS